MRSILRVRSFSAWCGIVGVLLHSKLCVSYSRTVSIKLSPSDFGPDKQISLKAVAFQRVNALYLFFDGAGSWPLVCGIKATSAYPLLARTGR